CRMLSPESLKERLIFTTRMGNIEAVEMLLDFGVDPNTSVGPGLYAYHAAKMSGRDELAELLISRGADDSVPAPAVEKLVDYVVQRAIKENTPGAAVLVARDGKILLQKGYGLADVGKKIPVAPKTTFRIGSITKQFTASAILKLQEEGKLSVEDPLSKYVPDFPRGDQVTIHHLLTHISGIHSFTSTDDFLNKVLNEITTQEMIETIKGLDYDFDPGETWLYNNSGFFLLGYIVEKVSGLDFDTFLKKKFFIPLEMENTGVYSKDVKFDAEATGYSYENDSIKVALDWDMSHAGGAGNLYSNVINLYKWNEGVFNGRVLSETSLKAALTPVKLNNGQEADVGSGAHYGYGWGISIWRGLREISHGGGLHGFSTVLTRFPEKNTTVIVLSNCAPALPGFAAGQVAHDISEIFLWQEMEKQESYRAATNVNYAVYDDYVGQYDYKSAILTVTRDGEHLYAQLSGQARYEIFPRSENEFFWKITDAQATFIRDENGVVTHVVHHQGGATFDAPRMEQRKIVKLDPSLYEKYIGEYQLQAGIKISISAENDRIFLQVTGQPKVELFPESETAFFLKVVNAQVDFIAGQTGKATELILHQAGMDMPAKRVEME
ncbi:serine hydrolase, partial [candidate division KSB1 bacterium]|nr:serine hydrolase [candidate division KSB1 bacterium]